MALGHGRQDAQKTMGVIFLALLTVGWANDGDPIPLWVKLAAASAISLGTYAGGWRIMRTLGRKIIDLSKDVRDVTYFTTRDLTMTVDVPQEFQLDGDEFGVAASVHTWVDAGALTVMVPRA